jgi:KDO2-lipid IV(A) lauroyltransferase
VTGASLRHRAEHAAYRTVGGLLRLLPHPAARALGRSLGALGWLVDRRHRRVALENLALALPELPPRERRRLARECFRRLAGAVCDTVSATRFDLVALCRRVTLEGWEHLEAAEAEGRGVFILSAHLGVWEIAAWAVGTYAGPLHVVGRPLDNPLLDRELVALRGRFGNHLLRKRGAARGMIRALQAGEKVGILVDQRVHPNDGIEVPFFGQPSLTTPILARLALRSGTPVVPIFGHPEPGGRYRVVVRPPIRPAEVAPAQGEAAVAALTGRYLAATEAEIRRDPAAWLWLHRRWRR